LTAVAGLRTLEGMTGGGGTTGTAPGTAPAGGRADRDNRPLFAVLTTVLIALSVVAFAWPSGPPSQWWSPETVTLLLAVSSFGAVVMALPSYDHRPLRFVVRGGRFVVLAQRRLWYAVAALALQWLSMVSWFVGRLVEVDGQIRSLRILELTSAGLYVVLLAVLIGTTASAALGRPRVELTPEAVVRREIWGTRTVPWEALRPGGPPRPATGAGDVRLVVDRPELVLLSVWGPRSDVIRMAYADVHPWFLADAIHYYVDHPDRRAGIGTPAGHDHLRAGLGAP